MLWNTFDHTGSYPVLAEAARELLSALQLNYLPELLQSGPPLNLCCINDTQFPKVVACNANSPDKKKQGNI